VFDDDTRRFPPINARDVAWRVAHSESPARGTGSYKTPCSSVASSGHGAFAVVAPLCTIPRASSLNQCYCSIPNGLC